MPNVQLRIKLSDMISLTPDAVIEHVKNIFVEEGLLQKHWDCGRSESAVLGDQGCAENALPMEVYDHTDSATYNKADSDQFPLSVEDETCRTIMRLQLSLEELMDEFDQVIFVCNSFFLHVHLLVAWPKFGLRPSNHPAG